MFAQLAAYHYGLKARLDRLVKKEWILQPPGTIARKASISAGDRDIAGLTPERL